MPTLREVLLESFDVCIAGGRFNLPDVLDYAMGAYPDVFDAARDRLVMAAAHREAKVILNRVLNDTMAAAFSGGTQLTLPLGILPGMVPPLAIAVDRRDGSEIEYVRFDCATLTDLQAGLYERELNIQRAVAKRDDFLLKLDVLTPVMATDPAMTVAEACDRLQKDPRRNGNTD